jgi:hypothetical protein
MPSLEVRDSQASMVATKSQSFETSDNNVSSVQNLCTQGIRLQTVLSRPIGKSSRVSSWVLRTIQLLTLTPSAMLRKRCARNSQSEKGDRRELYELLGRNWGRHADCASRKMGNVFGDDLVRLI